MAEAKKAAGAKNKNQTAAERAAAAEALSGKVCTRCGKAIKLKDLLHVRTINLGTHRTVNRPYHRTCVTA